MEAIIGAVLSYLIGLAANLRTDAILTRRGDALQKQLKQHEALNNALASARPLSEELRAACIHFAQHRDLLGISKQEEPLWKLLSDEAFQNDLIEWFMAGGIVEGDSVKARMIQKMETALNQGGARQEQIDFLKTGYFNALDKAIFAHPILASWRHQLSLDYLREQVGTLRQHAEEAAGIYAPEKQKAALNRYCEKELAAWDIIDLNYLPEGDIHMATQQLLLRQLYMPLRIEVEPDESGEESDDSLNRFEQQRDARRRREAGHFFVDELDHTKSRAPVGECLSKSRRLVVLGDPGGGKTTMLRWMATAYLLRHKGDDTFRQIPDTATLPVLPWVPVLIRCRDLHESHLGSCFTDFLTQHLNKTELLPEEAGVMKAVILDRIAKGEILLLVDGLDEITNPSVRMMFCQELERTSARYPDTPIVVTSRIVGYRDMPYRMGSGFEHGVIAELNQDDKDLFAQRWVAVTEQHQTETEKAKRAQDLLEALHSSDRIKRLTGNPMLLTTLALVKRKVGKLPNRRNKLYAEAVSVLLNWNPRLYQTIEENEAIPQLEYLAYEMCRRGVQRLTEDELLDLLDKLRVEYPNVRAIRNREPGEFLALLEARSSILIKSGGEWQKNKTQEQPVWEFRHLTFQEYLAARALLDGKYPDRDKTRALAEQVAPLAGAVEKAIPEGFGSYDENEMEVPESWREALRLLVADCNDDDVDEVLLAILQPLTGEEVETARPRAVLAALCLADEPNVSDTSAEQVLSSLAIQINDSDGNGDFSTPLERAANEVQRSIWLPLLKRSFMQEFCRRTAKERTSVGGLIATVEWHDWARSGVDTQIIFTELLKRLQSGERDNRISAALTIMQATFEGETLVVPGMSDALLQTLEGDATERHAGSWALVWLSGGFRGSGRKGPWTPTFTEYTQLIKHLEHTPAEEEDCRRFLRHTISIIDARDGEISIEMLLLNLSSHSVDVRWGIINALGTSGDRQAIAHLLPHLEDADDEIFAATAAALADLKANQAASALAAFLTHDSAQRRRATVGALVNLRDDPDVKKLLSENFHGEGEYIDPATPITQDRIQFAALRFKISPKEARERYESIAADFHLVFV